MCVCQSEPWHLVGPVDQFEVHEIMSTIHQDSKSRDFSGRKAFGVQLKSLD